jgi:hypothetical protein
MNTPDVIYAEVLRSLSPAKASASDRTLAIATHNAFYGNKEKAQSLLPVYREFVTRHHLLAWQEVDQNFLEQVAATSKDYRAYITDANSRGQAIGFTVHRRLEVVKTVIYNQLQNIMGVPDLRPALRLDLCDTNTGLRTTAIVIHYKSDHGGGLRARPVRHQQAKAQIEATQIRDEFVICLGDYNQYLGVSADTDPLLADGYSLHPRYDRTSTHANGGRIDGMFVKNVPSNVKITRYKVLRFWRNDKIGCILSDHALVSWKLVIGGI